MDEIKEQLKRILLKFLTMLQSRKFWAAVVAIFTVLNQLHEQAISPDQAIWAIVVVVITYSGLQVADDYLTTKKAPQPPNDNGPIGP